MQWLGKDSVWGVSLNPSSSVLDTPRASDLASVCLLSSHLKSGIETVPDPLTVVKRVNRLHLRERFQTLSGAQPRENTGPTLPLPRVSSGRPRPGRRPSHGVVPAPTPPAASCQASVRGFPLRASVSSPVNWGQLQHLPINKRPPWYVPCAPNEMFCHSERTCVLDFYTNYINIVCL